MLHDYCNIITFRPVKLYTSALPVIALLYLVEELRFEKSKSASQKRTINRQLGSRPETRTERFSCAALRCSDLLIC
jgi:hypothetical protein